MLDENLPHDLVDSLVGHDVMTVQGFGWAGTKNGELLKKAAGHIDAFVTMDRRLDQQHDVSGLPFGVVVVRARTNRIQDLLPMVDAILQAVATATPGSVQRVGA